MGPGVGAQGGGGGLCQEDVIMTALAPLESRHPRLGQSWWLWVMRPRCLHAHAAPAALLSRTHTHMWSQFAINLPTG